MMRILVSLLLLHLIYIDMGDAWQRRVSYRLQTFRRHSNWCSMKCPQGTKHIACELKDKCLEIHEPCEWGEEYGDYEEIILDAHNKLRNTVAKGEGEVTKGVQIANMRALSWDNDLAYLARCNLVKCAPSLVHDLCHTTSKFPTAGQNLGWKKKYGKFIEELTSMVQNWYDEVERLDKETFKKLGEEGYKMVAGTGHFTQLAWATTTHVGCAATLKHNDSIRMLEHMMTCNYGPAGNVMGSRMFELGSPASKCPEGIQPNTNYSALCGESTIDIKPYSPSRVYSSRSASSMLTNLLLAFTLFYTHIVYL